jgi:hypothetical protein
MDSWHLQRRGPELRVEITPSALRDHEEDAIIVALEGEVDADGVEAVHLTGSVLDEAHGGMTELVRRVGLVAVDHGKQLVVGPI